MGHPVPNDDQRLTPRDLAGATGASVISYPESCDLVPKVFFETLELVRVLEFGVPPIGELRGNLGIQLVAAQPAVLTQAAVVVT
jgi:hypothetical protein